MTYGWWEYGPRSSRIPAPVFAPEPTQRSRSHPDHESPPTSDPIPAPGGAMRAAGDAGCGRS